MACQCGCTTTVEPEEAPRASSVGKGAEDCGCGCGERGCSCGCGEDGRSETERHVADIRRQLADLQPASA